MSYKPEPIDTSAIVIPAPIEELLEAIAENTHDVWAQGKIRDGWSYGPVLDAEEKTHPLLVPYSRLPEAEKEYDRSTARQVIKALLHYGFSIRGKNP